MKTFPTIHILENTNLFWQYPVITEKQFFYQNKDDPLLLGFPWATIIDKNINISNIFKILIPFIKHNNYYTCCQHIYFKKLIPLFKLLKIKVLYIPHKVKNEDSINGITLIPCPLYAVNIEDNDKNNDFNNIDFLNIERKYLYSFVGGIQNNYISNIRKDIFNMNHNKNNTYIKNTGSWHFNNVVYSQKQNKKGELNINNQFKENTHTYNKILLNSRFSLCPSGSGPNSIRFWESLAVGAIPILLSDNLELPYYIDWDNSILTVKENNIQDIENILENITLEKEKLMRENCLNIYNKLRNNFTNNHKTIIHYCCGSYDIGDFGGFARYDYHIKLIYPNRLFFKGPQEKNKMLKLLPYFKSPLIITDNHLSCDIPNDYKIILVHHGSALTHAEREPQWNNYWKELCCNGQKKMLQFRKISNTHIVSISKFCIDEFTRFFPDIYPKFKNHLILHTSELNEKIYKRSFNSKPVILGNWSGFLKGEHIVNKLKKYTNKYNFNKLILRYNKLDFKNYNEYNLKKQEIYKNSDIFLQLSLSEGFSYSTLDAFLCGNIIVATDVGLTYKDVPENCFVKLDWKELNDLDYLIEKIDYAWKNKETLSKNAREFYLKNLNFNKWKKNMYNFIYYL